MADADREYENSSLPSLAETEQSLEDSTMYRYRDYSNVNEEELEQETPTSEPSPPPPSPRGSVESSIRVQKFPVKLYAILAQKEFHDIITWMPHGRSWKVLKPNLFESLVMPLFFEYSNYHSFNRLVNAWSFRRISTGTDRGSYYHEVSISSLEVVTPCTYPNRKLALHSFSSEEDLACKSSCAGYRKPTRNFL